MPAVVTDQFRIVNASNFIDSISDTSNSYYVFLGLANPTTGNRLADGTESVGIGRSGTWNNGTELSVPTPTDNLQYLSLYNETQLFGKKITTSNVKRVITKYQWRANTRYDMYRHDYDISKNPAPNGKSGLYNTNYYVMNSDYRVYICIDNGSSGSLPQGKRSLDEPTFTDLEPSAAGTSGDGYVWKYLYTVNPSDIIKFDSTKYIVLPNNWSTSTDPQIETVRDAGNSDLYKNQIKKIYIKNAGSGYNDTKSDGETVNILGDGVGGKAIVKIDDGSISSVEVISGGSGYTYGIVDLSTLNNEGVNSPSFSYAKLIPIIPPSKGHGYDLYKELGADKVLVYNRFDDSTKDFPIDTHFAQVGIIKNPNKYNSTDICKLGEYSSLSSMALTSTANIPATSALIGAPITQTQANGDVAKGYVASYDAETKVLKYWQDRSLYFPNFKDQLDAQDIDTIAKYVPFVSDGTKNIVCTRNDANFDVFIDVSMNGITKVIGDKLVNLGVEFTNGLANPEINKKTGDIIYIDNRKEVERDLRQKEDVKIILEF